MKINYIQKKGRFSSNIELNLEEEMLEKKIKIYSKLYYSTYRIKYFLLVKKLEKVVI